jgi:hypothetical protein
METKVRPGRDCLAQIFRIDDPDKHHNVPFGTCLLGYRGSIAHGMYIPSSDQDSIDDVDLMGIVIASEPHYFGLREWGSRGTKWPAT